MSINGYEINSAYSAQEPKGHGGRVVVVIIILALIAGLGYYVYAKNQDMNTQNTEQSNTEATSTAETTSSTENSNSDESIDDMSASIEAVLVTDDQDMQAIEDEFNR